MKKGIAKYSLPLLLAITLSGCSPTTKYPRKKLPDMLEGDGLMPVQIQQTANLFTGGAARKKLSEPTNDLAALCPPSNNLQGNRPGTGETSSLNIAEEMISGKSYYHVQVTGTANDSALLTFVQSYRPFAGSIVDMMINNGKEGAIIEFGSAGGNSIARAEFLVKNDRGQSFSVVFLWDSLSAGRASGFMNELQQLPGLVCTTIDSNKNF